MHILCVGISHHTAGVELRERIAYSPGELPSVLTGLQQLFPHAELAMLFTCNRTELYVARPLHGHPRVEELIGYLADKAGVAAEQIGSAVYHHDNERAIRHLLRVAGSLDSMVVGEAQILGQVKQAYRAAQQAGTVGKVLHEVFQAALKTAKRIRTETGIGAGRMSISSVAVDFARHLFSRLDDKTVVCVGAGKMAELTVQHFLELRPRSLLVTNRSFRKAEQLATRLGGHPVAFDSLDDHLVEADVVISSTGAQWPVVTAEWFRPLLRRRRFRPLFIIDIAVPRDFEPDVGQMANVYLYNVDALQAALAEGASHRNGQIAACEQIVEQTVAETYATIQNQDFAALIRQLRDQLHDIGRSENSRTRRRISQGDSEEVDKLIEEHTHRVVNKILHRPVSELGRETSSRAAMYATALRRLFDLDSADHEDEPERRSMPSPRVADDPRSEGSRRP